MSTVDKEESGLKKVTLSDGEWKLMRLLWKAPHTAPQLVSALRDDTGWSKGTVHIMLSRMLERGTIRVENGPRAKIYYPVLRQEEAAAAETKSFLARVYNGSVSMMVASLAGQNALKQEEIDSLYEILRQAKEEVS